MPGGVTMIRGDFGNDKTTPPGCGGVAGKCHTVGQARGPAVGSHQDV